MTNITRRLAAVAFADVAGWSRLVEDNDLNALQAWKALRTGFIEPKILEYGGRLVDAAGDAVFVEFLSAVQAVSWARDLQARPISAGIDDLGCQLRLRIGINVVDLLVDEGRLVGDGVNIAARIHQVAAPGEIVVTAAVREHVHKRIAVAFRDLGERQLKNIARPIRIYRVEAPGLSAPESVNEGGAEREMRALLAIEIPGSGQASEHDPTAAESPLRSLRDYVARQLLPAGGGRVVRLNDDGMLIDFPQARLAVKAAFAIQLACTKQNAGLSLAARLLPRIGMQIGDLPADDADLHGGGAGVAIRLSAIAGPGEIVVSSTVREQLTSVLDADIEDLGERYLKEMNYPVRAYRLAPPGTQPTTEAGGGADELRPSIAVIPFTEHGQGHESLGEILAEEVIVALSRSADLNVVSRLSTTAFRGRDASLAEVSAHLKAAYVISGAYRVSAGTVILAAELAEAKSGRIVWAKDFKGSVAGIVDGKDELVGHVVADASKAVMTREVERTQTQSLPSLETSTLLIGAIALMHRLSSRDFMRAYDMLQAVAGRAPRHAIPQAWLAKWHVLRVWQSWSEDPVADTRFALDCSQRALDNDSHCSLALAIDGFVHTNLLKSLDVAQERYDLALRVNPNDSLASLLRGMLHAFKGEGKQAIKDTHRALRLSPLDPNRFFYDSLAASAELSAGRCERAVELARRSLRANRMHASTLRVLAISLWQLERQKEARATVAELMRIEPKLTVTKWFERTPSSDYPIGRLCAEALRNAGVPE